MSRYDRDIDGALNQKRGDESPKVGDWEPSDTDGCLGRIVAAGLAIAVLLILWGGVR